MRRVLPSVPILLMLALTLSSEIHAQVAVAARSDRAPRFMLAAGANSAPVRVDPARVPLLRERVTLNLENVTLENALKAISRQANIRLVYSADVVPLRSRTSLKAQEISVAAALTEVLLDANVDIVISGDQAALVRRAPDVVLSVPGTVVGTVTETETNKPIVNAQVAVDGTGRALTDEEGRYRIANVPAGRRSISVISIGYKRSTQEVQLGDGATATVDFVLEVSPSQLDAVVVTVTGEQRMRELGHVVGRINADSLVREAPISTISQLLTGRIPGLQVFQTSGIVGGDVQLQVRTPNSLLLGTQPIVIVDGVRYTNTAARDPARDGSMTSANPSVYGRSISAGPGGGHEVTSPLNDLNPNDIETIEVVKGPTAVTLYGTDAANGVILITTKRGRAGPARWNVYTRGSLTETPTNRFPEQYYAWGTRPDGQPFGFTTRGQFSPFNCTLANVASGACAQDSIVTFNPLADPSLTIFENAQQWTHGMNVSGGTADIRYYIGGSFQQETGPIRMPQAFVDSIEAARGYSLPEEQLRPNALRNVNLRSNLSASFGGMQLGGNIGYVRRRNRTLNSAPYSNAGVNGNPAFPWGSSGSSLYGGSSPDEVFSRTSINEVDRFVAGASVDWRLLSWLQARAGAGMDLSLGTTHSLMRRGEAHDFSGNPVRGQVQEEVTQQRGTSADLGLTVRLSRGRVSSRTSLGAQYNRSLNEIRTSQGTGLVPGGESVVQADVRTSDRVHSETAALGSFAEQTLGFNSRLFLTAALRLDGASNFGQKYQSAVYPKASASWVISEEPFLPRIPGIDEIRLRYAFGASGQQAYTWMKVPDFTTPQGTIEGSQVAVIDVTALGNEHLRPERVREHEFGFDVAALEHRVELGFAWYRRRVVDQIMRQVLPPGLGTIYTNLGLTTARGFEANLNAKMLDSRYLSWDLSVNHSSSSTLLVDVGSAAVWTSYLGSFREGFSLGARFWPRYLGFEDTNGDGIIVQSELQWTDTAVYVGESVPPRTQSLHTTFGFLNRRLRASASFNRSAGHVRAQYPGPCSGSRCLPLLDPNTPLEEQARASVFTTVQATNVPVDEIRFSALTVTADLPPSVLSRVGVRSGMVSVSASNLALWTDYPGDPGSVQVTGITTGLSAGVPQARSWTFRFDVGF